MNLGDFIGRLELFDPRDPIAFDFVSFHPTTLDSYRGRYDELALGYANEGNDPLVTTILEDARTAVGKTFTGWKGGDFVMHEGKKIWVANPSEAGSTTISHVARTDHKVIIYTTLDGF